MMASIVALLLCAVLAPAHLVDSFSHLARVRVQPHRIRSDLHATTPTSQTATDVDAIKAKSKLFDLLDEVPSNAPTPRGLTDDILVAVSVLERQPY